MSDKKRVRFCDMNPLFYKISFRKEVLRRKLKDAFSGTAFAKTKTDEPLPVVVSSHSSGLIKRGPGIDLTLQLNKVHNIELACEKLSGTVLRPGEVLSFWRRVGMASKRRGYKDGRVIIKNKLQPGTGGGLCNLANTIHLLVLHSPLEVVEFHSHSDALAPDAGKRVPFSSGTSVSYNYIDYRFKNNTDCNIQLILRVEDDSLVGEIRSEHEFPSRYELSEEGHHFAKEGEKFYRISRIYKNTIDKASGEIIRKELVLDNHSEVMFDYSLIPQEMIEA